MTTGKMKLNFDNAEIKSKKNSRTMTRKEKEQLESSLKKTKKDVKEKFLKKEWLELIWFVDTHFLTKISSFK